MNPTPPQPPEQQRLLDAMVGTWLGDERLLPTPWDPKGGEAVGRTQARPSVGGAVVTTDYAEERDGVIVYRGHGVYAWDAAAGCYAMYWFDSMQPCPTALPAHGRWVGEVLTFELTGDTAEFRYIYDFNSPGCYEFRIQMRATGGDWLTSMHGVYVRQ